MHNRLINNSILKQKSSCTGPGLDLERDLTLCPQTFVSKLQFGCLESNHTLSLGLSNFLPHTDLLIYLNVYLCFYRIGACIAVCFILADSQVFGWFRLMTVNEEVGSSVKLQVRHCQSRGEGFRLRTKASNRNPDTFTPVGALFLNQMGAQ